QLQRQTGDGPCREWFTGISRQTAALPWAPCALGYGRTVQDAEKSECHGSQQRGDGEMHLLRAADRNRKDLSTSEGGGEGRSESSDGQREIGLPAGLSCRGNCLW